MTISAGDTQAQEVRRWDISAWHYGWLPAVVPAAARRFRSDDGALIGLLEHAGAEIVPNDDDADVEIGSSRVLSGRSPVAVVPLGQRALVARHGRSPRISASIDVRFRASGVRTQLRRRGYQNTAKIPWDFDQFIHLPGRAPPTSRSASEWFPRRTLVLGRRAPFEPTMFELALEAANATHPSERVHWPLLRFGAMIAVTDNNVLRTALGPGRTLIEQQESVLRDLAGRALPPAVASKVPTVIATGEAGLSHWSLERRVPGTTAPARLTNQLLVDCLEFLASLFSCNRQGAVRVSPREHAEQVARAVPQHAASLQKVARRIEESVAALEPGFGHGDFWSGNLLVADGRLTGVVDWESGGSGRMPLADLFHLRVCEHAVRWPSGWGPAIVQYLLPTCRDGGDEAMRELSRRLDLAVGPAELEALAVAYWLEQVVHHLPRFADGDDATWYVDSVERVLTEVSASRRTRPA